MRRRNPRYEELGINRFKLVFRDTAIEAKYKDEYSNNSISPFRLSIVIGALLYGLFGILDLYASGDYLSLFFIIRYAIVIPVMLLLLGCSFLPFFKKYWQILTSVGYIIAGVGMAIMAFLSPENIYYYGGLFLIFMAGYFFVKLDYLYAIGSGIVIILIYNFFPLFTDLVDNPGPKELITSNALFISANLIAVVALFNSQLVARTEFYQRLLLSAQQLRIKSANENLEKKVAERTELLQQRNKKLNEEIEYRKSVEAKLLIAKQQAEESDRLKSAFLANMSHEIRTPMNGIIGFLDIITETNISKNEREQYLEIIKQSGNRLLQTINDIVEISKIEAGELQEHISIINIASTFNYLNEFFSPEAKKKNTILKFQENCQFLTIKTDGYKLESILINLIKNAIKFTENGTIDVGVKDAGDQLEFYVKDNGQGIPEERQKAIFDRFVQADLSLTRGHEGSGLGLSICKAYTESLGGEIRLKSEPGIGSTFFFTINYKPIEEQETQYQQQKTTNNNSADVVNEKTILVAEDDEVSFELIHLILSKENINAFHAKNGQEALHLFKKHRNELSLVLMDIKMPVMDGIEATREIRLLDKNIPIIAQTSFALSGDKELAIEAGCTDYLAKPIKHHEIISKLHEYIFVS